ncbi:M50 family metallopeptidase [Archaeoglobus profundus]|uniref:Zinc metalloprotease n=1 Tax=Archaeoglobus profundus (strain DSM 5631 / JCM 9629 / NBRC 100127 / Av18) TaxID=572546 RepID=D2RGQ5_ARCPA|nr:M50 family metallopeptidase [Archaeoglobus profundus]ADB57480.1 CBS domain containing protein [Archaeoglobus profundus DSM 5631]
MAYSIRICRIFGIDVKAHISLALILLILSYVFYVNKPPFGFSDLQNPMRLIYSVVMAVSIFVAVLIHELSHSLVAKRFGARVREIILFIFGGVASIENLPKEPKKEFAIAIAGPLASLVLSLFILTPHRFLHLFGYFNLILAIFNLIPAFPMDGGRVLRSLLAKKFGYVRATRISANVGKAFAIFMGVFGLFYNIWLTFIALFIYIGAVEEERAVTLEGLLSNYKVGDVMTPNPICVTPDMTVRDVISLMLRQKHLGYPVVKDGRLVGIVTLKDITDADENDVVENVMSRKVIAVTPETKVFEALRIMSENRIGRLPVVEGDRVVGIISRSDIIKLAEILEIFEGVKSSREKFGSVQSDTSG